MDVERIFEEVRKNSEELREQGKRIARIEARQESFRDMMEGLTNDLHEIRQKVTKTTIDISAIKTELKWIIALVSALFIAVFGVQIAL